MIRTIMVQTSMESTLKPDDVACCIDDSGSTQSRCLALEESLLSPYLDPKQNKEVIYWSTQARLCINGRPNKYTFWGTEPAAIFATLSTKKLVQERSALLLATDGDIANSEINRMVITGQALIRQKALVVGLLVPCSDTPRPAQLNVSVVSALMSLNTNVLILGLSPQQQLHICFAKGAALAVVSEDQLKITPETLWHQLPAVAANDVAALVSRIPVKKTTFSGPIPHGLLVHEKSVGAEQVQQSYLLLEGKRDDQEAQSMLQQMVTWNWEFILRQARIRNQLPALRELINYMKDKVLPQLKQQTLVDFPRDVAGEAKLAEVLQQLIQLKKSPEESKNFEEARIHYKTLLEQQRQVSQQRQQKIKESLGVYISLLDQILRQMHELESAGWSLLDQQLGSNRARRAAEVKSVSVDEMQSQLDPDLANQCSQLECGICMTEGPAALLLIHKKEDETVDFTQDIMLDQPLAFGEKVLPYLSRFPVCFDCGTYFWTNGQDPYHSPVVGCIPLMEKSTGETWNTLRRLLQHFFVQGKELPHVFFLLYAGLDALQLRLSKDDVLREPVRAMLSLIGRRQHTHGNFSQPDENFTEKILLYRAMEEACSNMKVLEKQMPAIQTLMIRRSFSEAQLVHNDTTLQRDGLLVHCWFTTVVKCLRPKMITTEGFQEFRQQLIQLYFRTISGLPQREGFALKHVDHDMLNIILFGENNRHLIRFLGQVVSFEQLRQVINPEMVAVALFSLVQKNSRFFQKTFSDLTEALCADPKLMALWNCLVDKKEVPWQEELVKLRAQVLGQYHKVLDAAHHTLVPFELHLGSNSVASVIRCNCGYQFLEQKDLSGINDWHRLEALDRQLRQKRAEHFGMIYGSEYPSDKSAHTLLHKTVAQVCTENKVDDPQVLVHLSLAALAQTDGQKGDIYDSCVEREVQHCVTDFLRLRKQHNYAKNIDERESRSLKFKILCTAHHKGLLNEEPRLVYFRLRPY